MKMTASNGIICIAGRNVSEKIRKAGWYLSEKFAKQMGK